MKEKWAIFISGTGSNMNAILDSNFACEVALVVSSSEKAYGLKKARRAGIATLVLSSKIDWLELDHVLKSFGVSKIFLAGFMKILPLHFVEKWTGSLFNVHPSLLPSYPGLNSIERAYTDGARLGVTVHRVIPEVDAGEILWQAICPRGESLEKTEMLVHRLEHTLVRKVSGAWKLATTSS